MRLGAYRCRVHPDTLAYDAYKKEEVFERHRHRYEFNNEFRDVYKKNGMVISGINPERDLVEVVELKRDLHPWFLGCQFHPEFKSRPFDPHPLFVEFVRASIANREKAVEETSNAG